MKRFLEALSSIKLAVGLIVYLAVAGVVATLLPRGSARATGPSPVAVPLVLVLVPVLLFLANLSTCAARRFLRELRKKGPKRFGPDALHLGLVLLIVGGIWSWAGRVELGATLEAGEGARLPDGSTLTVRDFRYLTWDDGRPRDWVAVVDLAKDGSILVEGYELRVNAPLRHAGLSFYQSSYVDEWILTLRDADGAELELGKGDRLALGGSALTYDGVENPEGPEPGRALVRATDKDGAERILRLASGERIQGLEVAGLRHALATGIGAVSDPGYPLVLAALALVALGTAWTFLGKLKEAA